jgi:hypothetical protein
MHLQYIGNYAIIKKESVFQQVKGANSVILT